MLLTGVVAFLLALSFAHSDTLLPNPYHSRFLANMAIRAERQICCPDMAWVYAALFHAITNVVISS